MKRWQTLVVLAASLGIFFFVAGPVWRHPWSIDASVYWSYAAIPALVAAMLLVTKKWGWRAFLLGTLEVTLLKFGVTYGIATVLWATGGQPPAPAPVAMPGEKVAPMAKRAPSSVGELAGHAPPGALVWIDGGLESYSFPAPREPVEMQNDGHGFQPTVVAVQVGQPLHARVTDGHTHTLHAKDDKSGALRNLAVPAGPPRTVDLTRPLGLVEVNCLVHPHGEAPSWLLVLAHPFFVRADAQGRFVLHGVPTGPVRISAFDPARGRVDTNAQVPANDVTLEFAPRIE